MAFPFFAILELLDRPIGFCDDLVKIYCSSGVTKERFGKHFHNFISMVPYGTRSLSHTRAFTERLLALGSTCLHLPGPEGMLKLCSRAHHNIKHWHKLQLHCSLKQECYWSRQKTRFSLAKVQSHGGIFYMKTTVEMCHKITVPDYF